MPLEPRVLEESHIRRPQRISLDFSHQGVLGMLHFICSFADRLTFLVEVLTTVSLCVTPVRMWMVIV
jgi:hypothetical protein